VDAPDFDPSGAAAFGAARGLGDCPTVWGLEPVAFSGDCAVELGFCLSGACAAGPDFVRSGACAVGAGFAESDFCGGASFWRSGWPSGAFCSGAAAAGASRRSFMPCADAKPIPAMSAATDAVINKVFFIVNLHQILLRRMHSTIFIGLSSTRGCFISDQERFSPLTITLSCT
jgi:hypothetical protein